ncbi:hypothetical protein JCM11251_005353 [Rhodosporidiobolus azoricus]
MAGFADLSPELIEAIFRHTVDGPSVHVDRRRLQRLQRVNKSFGAIARRLLFRRVVIDSPARGAKLLEALKGDPSLTGLVRFITVKEQAFGQPSVFSDLTQDDLLRLCTKASAFDSPYASFAPLKDGRQPLACYPKTLQAVRLGTPFARSSGAVHAPSDDSSDDDSADESDLHDPMRPSKDYVSLLTNLPTSLKELKLSRLPHHLLPSERPTPSLRLTHLTSLVLDFVTISPVFLDWLVPTARLEKLQLWCVRGVSASTILQFVRKQSQVKEVLFKPQGSKQGTRLGNEIVVYLPTLERLTLGSGACDHEIYSLLPPTLTHLCVSLPNYHNNTRLLPIAQEITTRLMNLRVLELYSQLYFPSTIEVIYPPRQANEPSSLREVRLSHITAAPGEIISFLDSVGSSVFTLAVHHVSEEQSAFLEYCPSLRRLEVGRTNYEPVASVTFFEEISESFLSYLRIHFDSGIALSHVLENLAFFAHSGLRTLELVGVFPGNLSGDWLLGGSIDELVEQCKAGEVDLCVNGRMIETVGDLWRSLVGQTGRETL